VRPYKQGMKPTFLPLAALLAVLLAPSASWACRAFIPPSARVQRSFEAIVVGRVETAAYTAAEAADWHPWSGVVSVEHAVLGINDAERYAISRTGSSAACDDGQPPPEKGERWVVYLSRNPNTGALQAVQSYPLHLARQWDSRLASAPD
jgi:hypothetical protein